MPDLQFLIERYRELPKFYQDFVASDYVSETTTLVGSNLNLNDYQKGMLSDGIILMLMFIFNEQDLEDYLGLNTQADPQDIHAMVALISRTLPEFRKRIAYEEARSATEYTDSDSASVNSLATEIAQTEKALSSLQSIRTMATDMKTSPNTPTDAAILPEEQVHSSSQADILPNGNTVPEPRWESEVEK